MRPSIDDRGQTDRVTMHATDCCTLLFASRICYFPTRILTLTLIFNPRRAMVMKLMIIKKVKVKFSHTRYRALGSELIPVYGQSARR